MAPSVDDIRGALTPLFSEQNLLFVTLFGSAATGKTHSLSDIDLAFLFDATPDILLLTNRVVQLLHTDKVDVVDLTRSGSLLRMSVVRTGKLLYERHPGVYNQYCSLSFRMYADAKKFRDAQAMVIRKFIETRGTI